MYTQQSTHHSLDCSMGLSFCAIWYKALIAFILNSGGFLSATDRPPDVHGGEQEQDTDNRSLPQSNTCLWTYVSGYWTVTVPNSMQVIPKDQMSTFPSYCPSSIAKITSGAILKDHGKT